MKKIGEKNKIQFAYEFKKNPFDDEVSWGQFQLYVNNKDICEVIRNGVEYKYEWSLIYLVDWIVNNIDYIIGYDPFPFMTIYGDNLSDMLDLSWKKEFENNSENILWYEALGTWEGKHTWSSNDDGSGISNIYFYRRENEIEIAWNNKEIKYEKMKYSYLSGSEKFEIEYFKSIILEFIKTIITDFEVLYKENKYILELKEKFNFWVYKHDLLL